MKKIYKILMLCLMLSVLIQTASALKEGQDYVCIDAVNIKNPPVIDSSIKVDKNIEKVPLCSEGKVPKSIIKENNEIILDINASPTTATCTSGICRDVSYSSQNIGNIGVRAYLTQHSPSIDSAKGVHSKTSISSADFNGNGVEVGWRKTKGDVTRLSTSWWAKGVFKCYNDCGWIQLSSYYFPGMSIDSNNIGINYEILSCGVDTGCASDSTSAGWYIFWNDELLGYYPHYLWENTGFTWGDLIKYQGEIISYAPATTTDMGNGLWASNPYAASIYQQQFYTEYYYDEFNWFDATTNKIATSPSLYSVLATDFNSMRYGGPGVAASFTVTSPNGGERWSRGTTKRIKWSYTGNGAYVKLELLKSGLLNRVINSYTPNDGSYDWYISPYQSLGSDYKIRITSTSNSAIKDTSNNNFAISNPYIIVISPNGGENWQRGTTRTISWKKDGNVGPYIKIQLYKSGILKNTISSSTLNDGSYSWTVPWSLLLGSDYKIKITSTSNSIYYDWSNNYFRIY